MVKRGAALAQTFPFFKNARRHRGHDQGDQNRLSQDHLSSDQLVQDNLGQDHLSQNQGAGDAGGGGLVARDFVAGGAIAHDGAVNDIYKDYKAKAPDGAGDALGGVVDGQDGKLESARAEMGSAEAGGFASLTADLLSRTRHDVITRPGAKIYAHKGVADFTAHQVKAHQTKAHQTKAHQSGAPMRDQAKPSLKQSPLTPPLGPSVNQMAAPPVSQNTPQAGDPVLSQVRAQARAQAKTHLRNQNRHQAQKPNRPKPTSRPNHNSGNRLSRDPLSVPHIMAQRPKRADLPKGKGGRALQDVPLEAEHLREADTLLQAEQAAEQVAEHRIGQQSAYRRPASIGSAPGTAQPAHSKSANSEPSGSKSSNSKPGNFGAVHSQSLDAGPYPDAAYEDVSYRDGSDYVQAFDDGGAGGPGDYSPPVIAVTFRMDWRSFERLHRGAAQLGAPPRDVVRRAIHNYLNARGVGATFVDGPSPQSTSQSASKDTS